jgi:hypothetical protein
MAPSESVQELPPIDQKQSDKKVCVIPQASLSLTDPRDLDSELTDRLEQ